MNADAIKDGFRWKVNKWQVDDNFFISLKNRLQHEDEIRKAIRLFLFHEALHYKRHKLTDLTSVNIGSFAKVLETADYQADIYALLNEYGFNSYQSATINNPKEFFLESLNVATETMWSFDDYGHTLQRIQIRRLNRYMIWYWQMARIEKEGESITDIIRILQDKPVIELNGLVTREEDNRFFFELEASNSQPLELAVFHNNRIVRHGRASNLPIEDLVQGVVEMKAGPILDVIRSFFTQ